LNKWASYLEDLSDLSWALGTLGVFTMFFASGGILNLVSGMMVQAAYHVAARETKNDLEHALRDTRSSLLKLIHKTHEHMEVRMLQDREDVRQLIESCRDAVRDEAKRQEKAKPVDEAFEVSGNYFKKGPSKSTRGQDDSTSPGRPSPRTPRKIAAVTPDEGPVDPVRLARIKEDAVTGCHCKFDKANFCEITHATWCSTDVMAIGYHCHGDGNEDVERNPLHSSLYWDGAHAHPKFLLPEVLKIGRSCVSFEVAAEILQTSCEKIDRVRISRTKGELVFQGVPNRCKVRFRFGGNFSVVDLPVDCPPHLEDKLPMDLANLVPLNRDLMTLRELIFLLSYHELKPILNKVEMHSDQLLTVFNSLDSTATGSVRVDDFIDGFLRLRCPEEGIDVAGAKSMMRRLIMEIHQLGTNAVDSGACFGQVVQAMRGVDFVDVADPDDQEELQGIEPRSLSRESTSSSFVAEAEMQYHHDIAHLRAKVARMSRYVRRKEKPPVYTVFGTQLLRESTGDEDSITSAPGGWD